MKKVTLAFICVHNSCRSQIAEALAKAKYSHVFEAFSAGTGTKPGINQDAGNYERTIYYRYGSNSEVKAVG